MFLLVDIKHQKQWLSREFRVFHIGMNLLKCISKPQHCQSLAFSWWGTPKPLGFSFWGLPVVRHHWLRGLLVCPNWRMWSRRRFGIFGMTHLKKPCIEHPNGSLVGSLAKSGERRLHKCGPLILCYHLRPTLRLARGGWCIRIHQDAHHEDGSPKVDAVSWCY